MVYKKEDGIKFFEDLEEVSKAREENMKEILHIFIKATDDYGKLISRLTLMLGNIQPKNKHDVVQRDLLADVFDNLYEARTVLLRGKYMVAYPITRRAFESLTLKIAFHLEPKLCDKWIGGKQVGNEDVRKTLEKHKDKGGEPIEETRKLYKYFSQDSHPNYFYIPQRLLGDGNQYVLGSIGQPLLYTICHLCQNMLELWHWFTAYEGYYSMEYFEQYDKEFQNDFRQVAQQGREAHAWLNKAIKDLWEEIQEEKRKKNE